MKKLKKALGLFAALSFLFCGTFVSCSDSDDSGSEPTAEKDGGENAPTGDSRNYSTASSTPTIYLAGDSTVQTYPDAQYIGGWGQYLQLFLNESNATVVNCAKGGRSARSFINEGRLFNNKANDSTFSYSFSENDKKSIEEVIQAGDFLFIQFGHNDDDTKDFDSSSVEYRYLRMEPLDESHEYGTDYDAIVDFPVVAGEKQELTADYLATVTGAKADNVTKELAKYGKSYYPYGSGTYKWYLKQYVDFAREKGAVPVLVTPVARESFNSDGTLKSGAGLHGKNWAYVQAVRQLAEEENVLLIDLFAETKTFFETATPTYANFLMAIVNAATGSDDLTGEWPSGYDNAYDNPSAGFSKVDGTHYNKYGAFLCAAKVTEQILANEATSGEWFAFKDSVLTTPTQFIDPSNRMAKSTVAQLEGLFTKINVTNPARTYPAASEVVSLITEKLGENASEADTKVTNDTYLDYQATCEEVRAAYEKLNYDDRDGVTNLSVLMAFEAKVAYWIDANRPHPTGTEVISADQFTAMSAAEAKTFEGTSTATGTATASSFKFVGGSGTIQVYARKNASEYQGNNYKVDNCFSMGGAATFGTKRYVEFTTAKPCSVTVIANSGADDRKLNLVSAEKTADILASFPAPSAVTVTTKENLPAGTYQIGSASSGVFIYNIIIEYFE